MYTVRNLGCRTEQSIKIINLNIFENPPTHCKQTLAHHISQQSKYHLNMLEQEGDTLGKSTRSGLEGSVRAASGDESSVSIDTSSTGLSEAADSPAAADDAISPWSSTTGSGDGGRFSSLSDIIKQRRFDKQCR